MQGDEVLAQLTEMFGDYIDQERIQATVKAFDNDLQACVEQLLKDESEWEPAPESSTEANKENLWNSEFKIEESEPKLPPQPVLQDGLCDATSKGAIKKTANLAVKKGATSKSPSYASFLQASSSNINFGAPLVQRTPKNPPRRGGDWPSNFDSLVDLINGGYRVMVIMRGAPGSGKSFLSRTLIDRTIANGDYRNYIFSADDYFIVNGVYRFQPDRLDEAHRFCQTSARTKARDGWSPIVIDNTNMRLWEMHAYVQIAAEHGYHLEILEPVTYWRRNARSLATRNTHGVPEVKIKQMLTNYEPLTNIAQLYIDCKLDHAVYLPPRKRHYPIFREELPPLQKTESERDNLPEISALVIEGPAEKPIEWTESEWDIPDANVSPKEDPGKKNDEHGEAGKPKPARETPKHMASALLATSTPAVSTQEDDYSQAFDFAWEASWKSNDSESDKVSNKSNALAVETDSSTIAVASEVPQLNIPASKTDSEEATQLDDPNTILLSKIAIPAEWRSDSPSLKPDRDERNKDTKIALVKHRRGCKNENQSFSEICNLYPHIPAQYLWDLFEKCNGDGDWTANLLLEEQKSYEFVKDPRTDSGTSELVNPEDGITAFDCNCLVLTTAVAEAIPVTITTATDVLLQPLPNGSEAAAATATENDLQSDQSTVSSSDSPRSTIRRKDRTVPEEILLVKKQLESSFVLGKQHYSNHIQQIRKAKGIITKEELLRSDESSEACSVDDAAKSEPDVIEVTLGVDLIRLLHDAFKEKHSTQSISIDELTPERTKVFLATGMAEQLYLSFLDTMYSCCEEEKLQKQHTDAQMARQMEARERYPILFQENEATCNGTSAPNLADIIEMEHALSAYRNDVHAGWIKQVPQNLASQMTRQKLAQMFPSVEENVLTEILHAFNNKFHDTVKVLNHSIPEELRNQIARERETLLNPVDADKEKANPPSVGTGTETPTSTVSTTGVRLSDEDAINMHLRKAEECRNLAQHHQELKIECHEKARNAIQRGMPGVANYYAQIARLHRTKIDMYNSRASNSIMEVHKLTLNNADVLDLHYLHSEEALQCLEIFLAEQARKLRNRQLPYKELFIITGRGLHSADGIPIIKHRVKAMLRDLGLRYVELNPGFLKIKLHNNFDILERLMIT